MSRPTVHPIRDDELGAQIDVVRTAFLSPPLSPEAVEGRRRYTDIERCLGAYDGNGRLCGSARSFLTPLTVPGGEVSAAAVSAVGVLPTHTRQGHLSRLMRTQLADSVERGEPVAVLIAAEYPIYGRFGYGPATEGAALHIDATAAAWLDDPIGAVELVDSEAYSKEIDQLYDTARRATPGHIGWRLHRWQYEAGAMAGHDDGDQARREATKVLWRDGEGVVQGAASYGVDESWVANRPSNTLRTRTLVSTTARAECELLRFLAGIDWVSRVEVGLRPIDDPAPLTLVDGRAAVLTDRRYATTASLVVEVADPLGFADGRYRLDAGPDGAGCERTTDEPDLAVPVGALGAAYLGGHSWARLAAAGWASELRPGALATASALFTTARAPWGAVIF
jgi:predicted acetyltransferase